MQFSTMNQGGGALSGRLMTILPNIVQLSDFGQDVLVSSLDILRVQILGPILLEFSQGGSHFKEVV